MTGWIRSIRARNRGASWRRLALWEFFRIGGGLLLMFFYRFRWWGGRKVPAEGPVLLISNHQSFFDLFAIAMALPHRHFHPMGRRTLFDNPIFGKIIEGLNAFPVDQDKADLKAMRTAIDRLKQGHLVLIFPEGSRTPDGAMHAFAEGIMLVIKRARPTVVPMAVDGLHDAFPIGAARPALTARVGALVGDPIPADRLLAMAPRDARDYLYSAVDALRLEVRQRLRDQSHGRWPTRGPGDDPGPPPAPPADSP